MSPKAEIAPELAADRAKLKKKKVKPCFTCGGRVLRETINGKTFMYVHPSSVTSFCVGCRGFGSPELIPSTMIAKVDWEFRAADPRDQAVIRQRRTEVEDLRRKR